MSTQTEVLNTGQQAIINTDRSKIFVSGYETIYGPFNNGLYDPLLLKAGTVMGRVASTGFLIPLKSGASDGSQFPVGVNLEDITIDGSNTVNIAIVVKGDVVADLLVLDGTDTLDTTISSRRLRDRLAADTVGIRLVQNTEMTAFDNQ